MSVTLKFNTFKEKKPENGQEVIMLANRGSYWFISYELVDRTIKYVWEVLEDGCHTGDTVAYDGEEAVEGHILRTKAGDDLMEDDDLWMDEDEYWASFEEGESQC